MAQDNVALTVAGLAQRDAWPGDEEPADALKLCDDVLALASEYYSVWSFRKRVLAALVERAPATAAAVVQRELHYGQKAIARSPKSYWSWAHRKWLTTALVATANAAIDAHNAAPPRASDAAAADTAGSDSSAQQQTAEVQSAPEHTAGDTESASEAQPVPPVAIDWKVEAGLCARLLALDARNFHCWSYRRFVAAHFDAPADAVLAQELAFTRTKIDENFSNYSAWHQRSLLLTKMHQAGPELTAALQSEFELIQQAYYTEPEDQSAWVYHRWLVTKTKETETADVLSKILRAELHNCEELLELEPDSKWALFTSVLLLRDLVIFSYFCVAQCSLVC